MVNYYTYLNPYLNDYKKFLSLSDFEKAFNTPHQTIKRHLDYLVKKGILNQEKREKFLFYTLNAKNPVAFEYLGVCEKQKMFEFLENKIFFILYEKLYLFFPKKSFLIFGSAANSKGFNDIDLLVLGKSDSSLLKNELKDFETEYSIKVHVIDSDEKIISGTFINEVKKNHIILNNHGYFVRLFSKS